MSKIAVVFWSGTGNTEAMADAVIYGVNNAGAEGTKLICTDFNSSMMDDYDAIALGSSLAE